MKQHYTIIHKKFKLNNKHYSFNALIVFCTNLAKHGQLFEQEIASFLLTWLDTNNYIEAKTSGSTGAPKTLQISKQAMVNSAMATGLFFKLKPTNKALLCLPATYIAGKMMLVRAMVLGLDLDYVEPKSNLVIDPEKKYHFSAMVPMQLQKNIKQLKNIKHLIVGGTRVSSALISEIKTISTTIYETYGMTETVSHIAIKQLNNTNTPLTNNRFKTLPNISIFQDKRQCLIINAPKISNKKIVTNDIVTLHSETEFSWLGRFDTIINSGGIKVFPEQIEKELQDKIESRFFIASEQHETLGEQVIVIIEGDTASVNSSVFNTIPNFSKPQKVYYINAFAETSSGKIQRKKTLQLLKKQ